jgi:phage head maturation protease
MGFYLQGEAFRFEEPFIKDDLILYANSGCFDKSIRSGKPVSLLFSHDTSQRLGDSSNRLMIHAGTKSLVFRFDIPDGGKEFADLADDPLTYLPVSISHRPITTKTEIMRGVQVITILESELVELSVISGEPDVKSSYARVVSWDRCNGLQEDYEAGLFDMASRVIAAHRVLKSRENGGTISYRHTTSPYDRAADRFREALQRLE